MNASVECRATSTSPITADGPKNVWSKTVLLNDSMALWAGTRSVEPSNVKNTSAIRSFKYKALNASAALLHFTRIIVRMEEGLTCFRGFACDAVSSPFEMNN